MSKNKTINKKYRAKNANLVKMVCIVLAILVAIAYMIPMF
jgi:hypothetical protein